MAYSYDRRAVVARKIDLAAWDLDGLVRGESIVAYHGTTRSFKRFDPSKSRGELVNKFYGAGIFLTPSKRVAEKYAEANRNIGFEPSIIDDLRGKNPAAAAFLKQLHERGSDVWDDYTRESLGLGPEDSYMDAMQKLCGGIDPNTLMDLSGWIIGSKEPSTVDHGLNFFNQSTGMPDWVYKNLDEIGLDGDVYRPKVYTVRVRCSNPLVTANKSQARSARSKGYDCVVYFGSDLVDGVPEIAVFSPDDVQITGIEVV